MILAVKKIISELSKHKRVKAIYLFGSQARKDAGPLSDTDLCVLAPQVSEKEKNVILSYASPKVDLVLFEDLPLTIKVRVLREGKRLYVADLGYVNDLDWRTMKEYFDFKPILKKFIEVYLPRSHYV